MKCVTKIQVIEKLKNLQFIIINEQEYLNNDELTFFL